MSAGVDGMTTLSPGMCASSASRLCECWLPEERPAPNWVRTVSAISRGAAGHERQLRGLVEQLVEADAEEVEVHQLDHGAHARHRGADAEADDRALGDRRVADAIAEPVVQAARQAEHVAAGARRRCPRRTRARRRRARASSAARIASMVRNTGASAAGAGGSARSGRGRTTKSVSVAAAGRRQAAGPPRRRRRARARPTTAWRRARRR